LAGSAAAATVFSTGWSAVGACTLWAVAIALWAAVT
jgi:hypothetical protein